MPKSPLRILTDYAFNIVFKLLKSQLNRILTEIFTFNYQTFKIVLILFVNEMVLVV